jgi:hypothetical protein
MQRVPGTWCGKCNTEQRSVLHCRQGGKWRQWCQQCRREYAATVPEPAELAAWFDEQEAKAEKKVRNKEAVRVK